MSMLWEWSVFRRLIDSHNLTNIIRPIYFSKVFRQCGVEPIRRGKGSHGAVPGRLGSQHLAGQRRCRQRHPAVVRQRDLGDTRAPPSIGRLTFTNAGLTFSNPALDYLNSLANQNRVELETVNSFSDRCSPVQSVGAMSSRCSSLRGTTTLGGTTGWPRRADVELPTSDSLVDIGGTYHAPAHHISFSGITFSGTSWRGPGSTWLLGGHAGVTDPAVNALGLRAFDQLPHHLRPPDLAQSDEATEPAVEHAHLRPSSHVVARLGISRAATTATPDPITGRHEKNR